MNAKQFLLIGILVGLVAPGIVAQGPPPIVRDRVLTRVRIEPAASGTGRVKITGFVDLVTNAAAPMSNMGFRMRAFVEPGGAPVMMAGEVLVPLLITTDPACTNVADPFSGCTGGTCPPISAGSQSVSGTCEVYDISTDPNDYPNYICACFYKGVAIEVGDEVDVKPGDSIRVTISPLPLALPDTPSHVGNETLVVPFGSRADQPPFASPSRRPTPVGGQRNSPTASLEQVGLVAQGEGPYEHWGPPLTPVTLRHGASVPGLPLILVAGNPQTSTLRNPFFSLDIALPVNVIYDGLEPTQPWAMTGPGGVFDLPYAMPPGADASLQGVVLDPMTPTGLALTARNDVAAQDTSGLGAPAVPPLPGPNPFPGFRDDVIVPNHGQTASAPGMHDGTLHSIIGDGFDATDPSGTTVTVAGIAVDVMVVRPREILFSLLPAHEAVIGGPVEITSTGGTSTTHPDQMESWVFATPPASMIRNEAPMTSAPQPSGGFLPSGGLQGARGFLAPGTRDKWGLRILPPGTTVRAMVCEIDPATGQLVTRCSALSPGALCFDPAVEPRTQMPGGTNPRNDLYLQHITDNGTAAALQRTQNDGGPGTAPFAGAPMPGAATATTDDDTPFTMAGMIDALRLDFDPAAPGSQAPFPYLVLVTF